MRQTRLITIAIVLGALSPLSASAAQPRTAPVFVDPVALATYQGNLFVADHGSDSVTEISSAGSLVRTLSGHRDGIVHPDALAVVGGDLFVANSTDSVSELNATSGAVVRVIDAPADHLDDPVALAARGGDLWVLDQTSNSLTEIEAATGALVRTVSNPAFGPVRLDQPTALAIGDGRLFVANSGNDSLSAFSAVTGAAEYTAAAGEDGFAAPQGVAVQGGDVWVSDSGTDAVTELVATNGHLVQVITNSSLNAGYGFDAPATVLAGDGVVYVVSPPGSSPMVTQIDASSGDANWMMCNTNYQFNFLEPAALVLDGDDLWVANSANDTLTEMNATTGVLVQDVD